MNVLESLTKNPVIKMTLLKQLKATLREHKITLVTICLDDAGELVIEPYTEPVTLLTTADFSNLQKAITDGLC